MRISKLEFEEILRESPLYDPREIAQDIIEISERNEIEICESFLERHLDTISAIIVIAAALYFGGHLIAFLLR